MTTGMTAAEWARFEDAVDGVDLGGFDVEGSLMSADDLKFLLYFLREKRPAKVLEIGVHTGKTTRLLLRELSSAAALYSVDVSERVPGSQLPTGYVAAESYDEKTQARWRTYFGRDISQCIREIGGDIDFCILDTTHQLPGEILSYLAVLPHLKDGAVLILHDITLQAMACRARTAEAFEDQYCTELLFSAVMAGRKYIWRPGPSRGRMGNIGALVIEKDLAMRSVETVLNTLYMAWSYWPGEELPRCAAEAMSGHYPPPVMDIFQDIIRFQRDAFRENLRAGYAWFLAKYGRLAVWTDDEQALLELVEEKELQNPNLRLIHDTPGLRLAGREVEPPDALRRHGIKTVLVPQWMRDAEYADLYGRLREQWGAEKVFVHPVLAWPVHKREAAAAWFKSFLSRFSKVAFWGIGRQFKELMDEDMVAPANVYLVDRRPGGRYGGKPVEGPEIIRREGIETVIIPPAYRTSDGRNPAGEIRRELESRYSVANIIPMDQLFTWRRLIPWTWSVAP